jgi:hypothetical protein
MDNSATLLSKVCDKIIGISTSDYLLCKECIMMQLWKFCHPEPLRVDTCPLSVSGINGPTSEDTVFLPGKKTSLLLTTSAILHHS